MRKHLFLSMLLYCRGVVRDPFWESNCSFSIWLWGNVTSAPLHYFFSCMAQKNPALPDMQRHINVCFYKRPAQCPEIRFCCSRWALSLMSCQYPSTDLVKTYWLFPKVSLSGRSTAHVRSCLNSSKRETNLKSSGVLISIGGFAMFQYSWHHHAIQDTHINHIRLREEEIWTFCAVSPHQHSSWDFHLFVTSGIPIKKAKPRVTQTFATVWSAGGFRHDRKRSASALGSQGGKKANLRLLCRVSWEPHHQTRRGNTAPSRCTIPHLIPPQRNWRLLEHTWFLCRVPSSSSEELFMIPHRSFTILRRNCASETPSLFQATDSKAAF